MFDTWKDNRISQLGGEYIVGDGTEVTMQVGDPSTPKSNSFKQVIGMA